MLQLTKYKLNYGDIMITKCFSIVIETNYKIDENNNITSISYQVFVNGELDKEFNDLDEAIAYIKQLIEQDIIITQSSTEEENPTDTKNSTGKETATQHKRLKLT